MLDRPPRGMWVKSCRTHFFSSLASAKRYAEDHAEKALQWLQSEEERAQETKNVDVKSFGPRILKGKNVVIITIYRITMSCL